MMSMKWLDENCKFIDEMLNDKSPGAELGFNISLVLGFLTIILVIYVYGFM